MMGRVDQAIYQVATAEMLNFVPTIEGPAMKRSGFRYIRAAASTAPGCRRSSSATRKPMCSSGATSPSASTPTAAGSRAARATPSRSRRRTRRPRRREVSTQQSYDRLYMAHANHPPASLVRPTRPILRTRRSISPTARSRRATARKTRRCRCERPAPASQVTAGGAPFTAEHVGGYVMIEAMSFGDIKAWEPQAHRRLAGAARRR
jgi:hypothetical protein